MGTIAEEGSRAMGAASDLVDLLRLAHEAVHRIKQDSHASSYEHADLISQQLHMLRLQAEKLNTEIIQEVQEIETEAYRQNDPVPRIFQ